jgi:phenylacetate-coenzyme A ligase PaaK-like adenylate-forming protein
MTEMAVKLELVAGTEKPQKIAKTLALEMQTAFGLKIPVEVLPEGSLERGESSARRWHRL